MTYDDYKLATPPHYDRDESLALAAAEYFDVDHDDVDDELIEAYLESCRIAAAERKAGL